MLKIIFFHGKTSGNSKDVNVYMHCPLWQTKPLKHEQLDEQKPPFVPELAGHLKNGKKLSNNYYFFYTRCRNKCF